MVSTPAPPPNSDGSVTYAVSKPSTATRTSSVTGEGGEKAKVVPPPIPAAAMRRQRGSTRSSRLSATNLVSEGSSRPASMVLSRASVLDYTNAEVGMRSSESDVVSMSARSRTETMLQGVVDFESGYKGLRPYRNFYTNLRIGADELGKLDHR